MNWDIVEGKWTEYKGKVKQQWGALTDDEIAKTEGRFEEVAGLIQSRYGKSKEEAEREVKSWMDKH